MTKRQKLLLKAKSTPGGLTFQEFETLLAQSGWEMGRQGGSHRIWIAPNGRLLSIQNADGKAKAYQVRQFLTLSEA